MDDTAPVVGVSDDGSVVTCRKLPLPTNLGGRHSLLQPNTGCKE